MDAIAKRKDKNENVATEVSERLQNLISLLTEKTEECRANGMYEKPEDPPAVMAQGSQEPLPAEPSAGMTQGSQEPQKADEDKGELAGQGDEQVGKSDEQTPTMPPEGEADAEDGQQDHRAIAQAEKAEKQKKEEAEEAKKQEEAEEAKKQEEAEDEAA